MSNFRKSLNDLGKLKNAVDLFGGIKELASANKDMLALDGYGEAVKEIIGNMNIDKAAKGLKTFGLEGENLANVLAKMNFGADEIKDKLDDLGSSGKSGEKFITKLGNAFTGLMSKIPSAVKGVALITAALGAAGIAFNAYNDYIQESVATAKEQGETWTSSNKSLEDYASRIRELRTALDGGSLTEKAAYDVKSELYEIQKSLISTYGDHAAGISLVNGNLEEQIALVEALSVAEANDYLKDNSTGVKKAAKEMTKERDIILGQFMDYGFILIFGRCHNLHFDPNINKDGRHKSACLPSAYSI